MSHPLISNKIHVGSELHYSAIERPCQNRDHSSKINIEMCSSQEATIPKLLDLAQEINQRIKCSNIAWYDEKGNEALLSWLQTEYSDFAISFPIVLRWLVQMREYHPSAFRDFIYISTKKESKSREEYLNHQAEYLVLLQKYIHNKSKDQLKQTRNIFRQLLYDEDKEFLASQKPL